jgi:hypothetical protein
MAGSGFFHRVVRFNSVLYPKKKKILGLVRISQVPMIFIFLKFQLVLKVVDSHKGKNNQLS